MEGTLGAQRSPQGVAVEGLLVLQVWNHGMLWAGRDPKISQLQSLCLGQGCRPLTQAAQGRIPPGPERCQGRGSPSTE